MKKNISILYIIIMALILAIAPAGRLHPEIKDSKGKDFWLTFLPNEHLKPEYDSLYIFITGDDVTKGYIEYVNKSGVYKKKDFEINNPSEIYTFSVFYLGNDLEGYESSTDERNYSERISPQYFHIVTDNEVTVYAHSQGYRTSEAFIVLPTDVLGLHYYVMSYNSDHSSLDNSTPSEFAVLSPYDDNEITIKPSSPTMYHNMEVQKITLNKGESYLVQALLSDDKYDLTSTEIYSKKPLAVFSGHKRAIVPIAQKRILNTRDILIEQLLPVVTWGEHLFLIPYFQSPDATREVDDIYRIMAAFDKTVIKINGNPVDTINKGEFIEGNLNEAAEVNASRPVMLGQYKKTAQDTKNVDPESDPFFMIIPPREQFLNTYRVINLQALEYDDVKKEVQPVYNQHYITVVVPDNSIKNLVMDGEPVSAGGFKKITASGYSYSHLKVKAGPHNLSCDKGFGILVYGYGIANSYGYIGGMRILPLDLPPMIAYRDSCYSVRGEVTDSTIYDSGLVDVFSPSEKEDNVIVKIDPFEPYAKTVAFSAHLADIRKDGAFAVAFTDSSDNADVRDINIPGFTLSTPGNELSDTIPVVNLEVEQGQENCFNVTIKNYGRFTQKIEDMSFSDEGSFTIKNNIPPEIESGDSIEFEVCFYSGSGSITSDSLRVYNNCGSRPVLAVNVNTGDCDETAFEYPDFKDHDDLDFNGEARDVIDFLRLTDSKPLNIGSVWYDKKIPVKNGFTTEFKFRMSSGSNSNTEENSLPGADGFAFVIQNDSTDALGAPGGGIGYENIPNSIAVEFDLFRNDSTQFTDYKDPNGNHVAVQSLGVYPNKASHGEATLGITPDIPLIRIDNTEYYAKIDYNIEPGKLRVFLNETGDFGEPALVVDKINIPGLLDLEDDEWAYAGFTSATGNAYEKHEILSWRFCPEKTESSQTAAEKVITGGDYKLNIYPNPVSEQAEIKFYSPVSSTAAIELLNTTGKVIEKIFNGLVSEGLNYYHLQTGRLAQGIYFLRIIAGQNVFFFKVIHI